MESNKGNVYLKILVNLIVYIVAILFFIFLFPKVFKFFLPFIIGWIISSIANPLVKFLEQRIKILRKHSSALIIIIVIALVILAIYGVIAFLVTQTQSFIEDFPNITKLVTDRFNQVVESLSDVFGISAVKAQKIFGNLFLNIREEYASLFDTEKIPEFTISFARNVVDYIFMTLIVFMSAYFFIKDRNVIMEKVKKITPKSVLANYNLVVQYFKQAVGGYFKAQFKIMLVLVIIMFVGFRLMGINYSFLIAVLTGILDVLPVFGTGAVLWPWALVEFILGNYFEAIMLMVIYLVCQLVKNILQPKLVGDSVGLNPLATLLFMYIGYRFAGIVGLIIAIPLGLVIVNLVRAGMFDNIKRGFKILFDDINKYRKF